MTVMILSLENYPVTNKNKCVFKKDLGLTLCDVAVEVPGSVQLILIFGVNGCCCCKNKLQEKSWSKYKMIMVILQSHPNHV